MEKNNKSVELAIDVLASFLALCVLSLPLALILKIFFSSFRNITFDSFTENLLFSFFLYSINWIVFLLGKEIVKFYTKKEILKK